MIIFKSLKVEQNSVEKSHNSKSGGMITANKNMILNVLGPIWGTVDIDDEYCQYKIDDPESETEIKDVLFKFVKPYFEARTTPYKDSSKRALSYYLTTDRVNFFSFFDQNLFNFGLPENAKLFSSWPS